MRKVRIGVFGGNRGLDAAAQLCNSPDAELVAVCDRFQAVLDTCKKTTDEAGLYNVAYYTDFEEFFKHDMDAVILANFAHEHAPYAIRFLDSGRHVMAECMPCACMKEAVELIEAVERSGKIYAYAENLCYMPAQWEMRRLYRQGDIGELTYAEGEYVHDCSGCWPEITYGDRNHWRNLMNSTFYCSHSIGPILKMTGLRPVKVSGFETPNMPYMRNQGTAAGTTAMEIITLENGALMKSVHLGLKHPHHLSRYQLNGSKGGMVDHGDGILTVYREDGIRLGWGWNETYTPKHVVEDGIGSGHGGGDFYTTHYFVRSILGDEEAAERSINVYEALEMSIPGIFAYRSIINDSMSVAIPNLRNKEEREAYRNDTFCTFPDIAGDQYVSNNIHNSDPIPDEVFEDVHRRWLAGEGKDL